MPGRVKGISRNHFSSSFLVMVFKTLLGSFGFHGAPLDSHGFLWVPSGFLEFLKVSLDSKASLGFLRVHC